MIQTRSLPRNFRMSSNPRSASSSSRTTRVFEELQENLESIQKEIANTKTQLEIAVENKEFSEQENEVFIENNKKLRAEIQEIMQVLESKQQLLDDTKKTYVGTENKVKQLKDEAMSARKELDDLKRRENTIEKECNTVQVLKEKQVQQTQLLQKSIDQTQLEFDKEINALQLQLDSVHNDIQKLKSTDVSKIVQENVEKQAKERELLLKDFTAVQNEIQLNNQKFISQVQEQLTDLLNEFSNKEQENPLDTEIINCKEDVDSLVAKVKLNTTVPL